MTYAPTAAGTHTATVSVPNSDSNENPYDFQVTGTGVAVVGDDHGNAITNATLIGAIPARVAGSLTSNDVDVFKVVLTASTTLTFRTTGTIDTYGKLLNASGATLVEMDDISSTNYNFSIRRTLAAGTYYVRVSGYDSRVVGPYALEVVR